MSPYRQPATREAPDEDPGSLLAMRFAVTVRVILVWAGCLRPHPDSWYRGRRALPATRLEHITLWFRDLFGGTR